MGEIGLPAFVGLVGLEPAVGAFGPLLRFGVIRPAAVRTRRIVENAGGRRPSCCSRAAIETGPWSSPAACSSPRSVQIRCRSSSVAARELLWGRQDRASTASQPQVW